MKKLIITSIAVLAMVALPMSNAIANPPDFVPPGHQYTTGEVVNNNLNTNVNNVVNTNRVNNTNTNRVNNTNVQGQMQGQYQSVENVNNNYITVPDNSSSDTRDTSANATVQMRGVRGFAAPAEINHVAIPSYFGTATKNSNVQAAKAMTMYKDTFTRGEVERALKIVSIDRSTDGHEESTFTWRKKKDPNQTIKVILTPPARGTVVQTALITTKAKNADTESKDVLYTALLRGLDTNADLLLITAEGAGTVMKSFGWGIGMSYTRSTLSADESTGGVSAGGLGISGGSAGYKSLPWIQAIGLKLVK